MKFHCSVLLALVALAPACGGKLSEQAASPNPSCASGAPGAGPNCGVNHDTDCCATALVTGGTYNRLNDVKWPASVSDFKLDLFEVTVGRFRAFVNAYPSSRPKSGDGAHPKVPGSGWQASWDSYLPTAQADLVAMLHCPYETIPATDHRQDVTWTDAGGANERMPASCMTWHVAFAFCAWDGGRLPTEAEWGFAAAGGSEQRANPWGNAPADDAHSVANGASSHVEVGNRPAGVGKWGQFDMGGSRAELVADTFNGDTTGRFTSLMLPCSDCLDSSQKVFGVHDLSFATPTDSGANAVGRYGWTKTGTMQEWVGVRCARTP
jgi:formylglycine-generating enzyme required for sulfatase activity